MSTSSIIQARDTDVDDVIVGVAWNIEQLTTKGVSIEIEVKWWGFTIVMNDYAVDLLDHCLDLLEDRFGHHFKETKLRRMISLCVQFKRDRLLHAVGAPGSNSFVRMVSPWVIPFALVVVRGASGNDQNLWFTVWDGEKWGEDAEFHECKTRNSPALAQHGEFLYCVHRGCDTDDNLWWTKYSTNDGWSDDTVFPDHKTELNPSLVEFKGTLYCFHRGNDGNHALYYCTFDSGGNTWHPDIMFDVGGQHFFSDTGCAVAVLSEELHLVFQNRQDSKEFKHLVFNGKDWRINTKQPVGSTSDTPALVAYQNKLLMVHRGNADHDKDQHMYYATYDGTSWSNDNQIPDTFSLYGPGMAVFGDKVFMAHRGHGSGDKALYYSIYKDSKWFQDTKIDNVYTGAPPALACYTDPQCNSDNYEKPETAEPRLICVHRGWG